MQIRNTVKNRSRDRTEGWDILMRPKTDKLFCKVFLNPQEKKSKKQYYL
jgi:hypothetical protein